MRDSPSAESALSGGNPNHLNFCESALLIAEFVNARAKTTVGDITKELDLDRRSASQYVRRLWVGGLIGKRARGLFVPATSAPAFSERIEEIDDSEQTEAFVGADDVEDTERVDDSRESDDNDESDEFGDTLQSGEGVQPEDTEGAQLADHEVPSASGFGGSDEIDDSDDRSLTDDRGASGGAEQSEDRVDTGDSEDSEDGSASAELSSGLHSTAVRKDGPEVCTAGGCPDCGSELGHATGKCLVCILERARAVTAS